MSSVIAVTRKQACLIQWWKKDSREKRKREKNHGREPGQKASALRIIAKSESGSGVWPPRDWDQQTKRDESREKPRDLWRGAQTLPIGCLYRIGTKPPLCVFCTKIEDRDAEPSWRRQTPQWNIFQFPSPPPGFFQPNVPRDRQTT